jgi:hypothetical protein
LYTVQFTLLSFINTILYILFICSCLPLHAKANSDIDTKVKGYATDTFYVKNIVYFMVWWNINYQCTCCLYGAGRYTFRALKCLDFQGPSAINRNIGNFLVHGFHSMPFQAQKSLDFQGPPLPMPLPIPPPPGRSEFTLSR